MNSLFSFPIINNYPLSGNVNQDIEYFFNSIKDNTGDGNKEKEIFTKVASYGKQLGIIINCLLELNEIKNKENENYLKLKQLKQNIDELNL